MVMPIVMMITEAKHLIELLFLASSVLEHGGEWTALRLSPFWNPLGIHIAFMMGVIMVVMVMMVVMVVRMGMIMMIV
jgi:hypothetical protein